MPRRGGVLFSQAASGASDGGDGRPETGRPSLSGKCDAGSHTSSSFREARESSRGAGEHVVGLVDKRIASFTALLRAG